MSKIYTKTGDQGQTSLIGGTRVSKHHLRVECYGTIDELNSYIGLVGSCAIDSALKDELAIVQHRLFDIGALLAADPKKSKIKLKEIADQDIALLEKRMDALEATLPPLKHFILPGGSIEAAYCHIARAICRRAERHIVQLSTTSAVSEPIFIYMNRLSDYLFLLARKILLDQNRIEVRWSQRL